MTDQTRDEECGWALRRVGSPNEQLAEIKRIRDYAAAPLPDQAEPRRLALEDRVSRMTAWLRNLADEMERGCGSW
jgi:hypothetical protein